MFFKSLLCCSVSFLINPLVIISNCSFLLYASVPRVIKFRLHWLHCVRFRIFMAFFKNLSLRASRTFVMPWMLICVLLVPDFQVEVQLDSHKHKQKGAVKRALFLDSQQPLLQKSVTVRHGERVCDHTKIYLKVSPLSISYSYDSNLNPERIWSFCTLYLTK